MKKLLFVMSVLILSSCSSKNNMDNSADSTLVDSTSLKTTIKQDSCSKDSCASDSTCK